MSTTQTVQEYVRASNDKFGTIWLVAVFVGGFFGALLCALIFVWLIKFFANNLFGCNLQPIHGELLLLARRTRHRLMS
jgi:hypothetical protein